MDLLKQLKEMMIRPALRVVDWTDEERHSFLLFLKSTTGRKFLEFLRQHAVTVTFGAVRDDRSGATSYARGVQDVVLLVTNLSNIPDEGLSSSGEKLEPLPSQVGRETQAYIPRGDYSAI